MMVEAEDSVMTWMSNRGLALYHVKLDKTFYLTYEAAIVC
jgi:hypothetical protein